MIENESKPTDDVLTPGRIQFDEHGYLEGHRKRGQAHPQCRFAISHHPQRRRRHHGWDAPTLEMLHLWRAEHQGGALHRNPTLRPRHSAG